ncbi:MAG: FAD-dependent oxidoreductase [Halanaerobiales bacterium]
MEKVVIVGGSDAGISAALRICELNPELEPLVITDNNFPNYSICGIPFYIGGEVESWQNLAHRTAADIEAEGVRLKLNTKVTQIKPEKKEITISSKNEQISKLKYDKLVLATGAESISPPIKGLELPGVYFMRWMEDCITYDNFLKSNNPEKVLIIGGGYVGLEMAEALTRRGAQVKIVEFLDTVLNTVDRPFRKIVEQKLKDQGIEIVTDTAVEEIEKIGGGLLVKGSDNFRTEADSVLVSVGAKPNTRLGEKVGIETGIKGAYKVNRKMETNIPDIYAGGDCTETLNLITGEYDYYALGTVAHKHGYIIGSNLCGKNTEFAGALGTQSIKIFDTVIARTGFNQQEAAKNGFEPIISEIEIPDHKEYYPPSYKINIRVVADKDSQKLLGAQILGNINAEISKRIDIFSTAIYNDMDISEFNQLDLSYTPPLSRPWDPVQSAVQEFM